MDIYLLSIKLYLCHTRTYYQPLIQKLIEKSLTINYNLYKKYKYSHLEPYTSSFTTSQSSCIIRPRLIVYAILDELKINILIDNIMEIMLKKY